jgi:predicted transcriptional regulator
MRALSIRQPYAELILRGIKTVEYRSRPTRIIGERFHIYASKAAAKPIWSRDLAVPAPADALPAWMMELAEQVGMIEPHLLEGALLPTGVIVGSAMIEKVTRVDSMYRWHLADVERATKLRKPRGHPQPVWFNPF